MQTDECGTEQGHRQGAEMKANEFGIIPMELKPLEMMTWQNHMAQS